mmetsp:Transcript_62538/g.167725  ORF Transcript_62538/g.167725 Transcript_62538/m.167725 type:complete len:202 (-) Transcript_62538:149-754(-)|eukprot:CAMPEP_0113726908 /NCGR_PEP_ID=MMETSP0038_2-20120614/40750_1 /TAXON_ID=2898 /ORGANISM="Cryptomonas paramecium" /LENGTH=201 /DNA_ID=CAMNT_0000657681 /DNA_START=403 /DNA_END=1008 /DNA_ORIENTATION=+ /assembly_acc=CAM_ASM_000170
MTTLMQTIVMDEQMCGIDDSFTIPMAPVDMQGSSLSLIGRSVAKASPLLICGPSKHIDAAKNSCTANCVDEMCASVSDTTMETVCTEFGSEILSLTNDSLDESLRPVDRRRRRSSSFCGSPSVDRLSRWERQPPKQIPSQRRGRDCRSSERELDSLDQCGGEFEDVVVVARKRYNFAIGLKLELEERRRRRAGNIPSSTTF